MILQEAFVMRSLRVIAAVVPIVLVVTQSTSGVRAVQETSAEPARPAVGRSLVATELGIVAASQPLAARAGVQILERGGNAIDAAIAANATLGLMEPTSNGMGGDLFALVYDAKTKRLYGLNSSGWAATGMTPDVVRAKMPARTLTAQEKAERVTEMPQRGVLSVTVPGAVAGWDALRTRFGRLPFSDILAPAIYYAEHGFPVSEVTAGNWGRSLKLLTATPSAAHTFLVDGTRAPNAGEVFRNPDLAASFRRVAAHGRDGFYTGPIADAIVAAIREGGGTMTPADLSEFTPEWVEPISTTYRGWTVSEIPPQGQGIAVLMMLNLMERFPLGDYGFHSPRALHVMIEAKKLAYADLITYVGDPRMSRVPVDEMLSKTRAADRARLIDPARASCSVKPSVLSSITSSKGNDTIYLTTIDRDGNMVSLIQSNYSGFGSGVVPQGVGFMLHNRGGLFTLEPDQPNTIAPRKRPLHTIIPGFMEKDGTRISFGIMGGWNQAQAHAQFVADIADFGFTPQEALEAGRFTKTTFDGCDLQIEELVPASTRDALTALGHVLKVEPRRTGVFGYGQAILARPDGVHLGASEPRHDGEAIPEAPAVFGSNR
jgi:gamma-glutamyltranspeptidase/glutathione hydrolase